MNVDDLLAACERARSDLEWSAADNGGGYYRITGCETCGEEPLVRASVGHDASTGLTLIVLEGRHSHHHLRNLRDLEILLAPPRATHTQPPSLRSRWGRRRVPGTQTPEERPGTPAPRPDDAAPADPPAPGRARFGAPDPDATATDGAGGPDDRDPFPATRPGGPSPDPRTDSPWSLR